LIKLKRTKNCAIFGLPCTMFVLNVLWWTRWQPHRSCPRCDMRVTFNRINTRTYSANYSIVCKNEQLPVNFTLNIIFCVCTWNAGGFLSKLNSCREIYPRYCYSSVLHLIFVSLCKQTEAESDSNCMVLSPSMVLSSSVMTMTMMMMMMTFWENDV